MTNEVPLVIAWERLQQIHTRAKSMTVPLSPEVLRFMIERAAEAWAVAAASRDQRDRVDAVRSACLWYMTCVVRHAIATEGSKQNPPDLARELRELWDHARALEAQWDLEAAEMNERVMNSPAYAAEMAGIFNVGAEMLRGTRGGSA